MRTDFKLTRKLITESERNVHNILKNLIGGRLHRTRLGRVKTVMEEAEKGEKTMTEHMKMQKRIKKGRTITAKR